MVAEQAEGAAGAEALIENVVRELRAAGGANLLGIGLYGSLVKGRFTPRCASRISSPSAEDWPPLRGPSGP